MKTWVLLPLLLAALLSACLQLGNAESDPLPQSLIDLVSDSPISSVEDLKLLLQQQGSNIIEDKEDEHDSPNPIHGRYIRSPANVQAQKAVCKLRTEVLEIPRSLVDPANANFMVLPQCVEVQRCSGCCNSRLMECAATSNITRNLEVRKIEFRNKKSFIKPVVIPVLDHVTCQMKRKKSSSKSGSSSSSTSSSTSSTTDSLPDPVPPVPQRYPASSPSMFPAHSPYPHPPKEDLHRHDDLKHNQHHHLPHRQDPLESQWEQGSYTQLARWPQPRVQHAPTYAQTRLTTAGFLGSVRTWPPGARAEPSVLESPQQDSATSQTYGEVQGDGPKDGTEREDSGSTVSGGSGRAEAADQEKENDSKLSGGADRLTKEERRKRLLEMVQSEPDKDPNLHPDQRPKTASSPVETASTAARQVPFRPASPRRRKRKHRKRISKSAMRAMIM